MLLHSWHPVLSRFTIRDAIVNVALYLPLGMVGFLTLRGAKRLWAVVLGGFLLSLSIELIQLFEPSRDSSALDIATNLAGTVLGVAVGKVFEKIAGPLGKDGRGRREADRGALCLVFVWVGYLVFPFFPLVGLFVPRIKLKLFLHMPLFEAMAAISAAAVLFAAGRLLRASGLRRANWWLALSLFAIPLQFFILDRQPRPSDLVGAALGLILFLALAQTGTTRRAEALLFLLVILLRGLTPFHFAGPASAFSLIPFAGFLNTEWQSGIFVMLEKGFYYGTAIWLLGKSGVRFWLAVAIVAGVLLAIEIAQTRLPGRTPEITDPVVAVLLGFGLRTVGRDRR
jgi:VanZ family protein